MFFGSSRAKTWAGPAKSNRVRLGNRQTASLSVGRGVDISVVQIVGFTSVFK